MPRLLPSTSLLVLALAPACAPALEVTIPDERGDVTITTWTDGEVTGGVGVSVNDDVGELRGWYESDADGVLVVAIEPGWSATVVNDVEGFRYVDSALGLAPGDAVSIGQRRKLGGAAPPLTIAPLAPVDGATSYTITVCGPVTTRSPTTAGADTTPAYDRRALDDDGGALIVAEASAGDEVRFALVDASDVTKLTSPVTLPDWQPIVTSPVYVPADAEALAIDVTLRSRHGCVVGAGTSATGGYVPVTHYPALPIDHAAATTWYARDDRRTSWTSRRVAVQADKAAPAALLADVPARVTDVAVRPYGPDGTVVGWTESGDPLAGDGVILVASPTYDAQWTLVMPRGDTSVVLPRLDAVPAGAPQWINVSVVDLDDVDDWTGLAIPRWDQPGWLATGTLAIPFE